MAGPNGQGDDSKLRLKLRPWPGTGFVLKLWGVGLGIMFALALIGLLFSLATPSAREETSVWFKASCGLGLLFGAYLLVGRLTRLLNRLPR